MLSTSVGSELSLPRSPMECENSPSVLVRSTPPISVNSNFQRAINNPSPSNMESPPKSRRMSFKEKFRKFTSPTLSRKQQNQAEIPSDKINPKMVDSGVGNDSDSCISGSFSVSSCSPKAVDLFEDRNKKIPSNGSVNL